MTMQQSITKVQSRKEDLKMEQLTVKALYNLDETIAKAIFENVTYPWEVLPKIGSFILELGNTLSEEEYEQIGENVWNVVQF